MRIAEATQQDYEQLRSVADRSLHLDRPEAPGLITLLWGRPRSYAVVAGDPGDPVGVAMGSLGGRGGHVDLLAVLPEHRRRGIGRRLLSVLEERLIEAGAGELWIGGTVDRYAWPGIDVRYTAAVCLVEAAGYRKVDEGVNMTVDLRTAPLDGDPPQGLDVRRLRPDEREDFARWMRRWEGSWPEEAARSAAYDPARVHVASDDSGYLGFACHGANRDSWFGPMGTDEAARGRGIGGTLLRRCLADQRDAGLDRAEIGWTGPIPFYSRTVGAYVDRVCWLYRCRPPAKVFRGSAGTGQRRMPTGR